MSQKTPDEPSKEEKLLQEDIHVQKIREEQHHEKTESFQEGKLCDSVDPEKKSNTRDRPEKNQTLLKS